MEKKNKTLGRERCESIDYLCMRKKNIMSRTVLAILMGKIIPNRNHSRSFRQFTGIIKI